MRKKDAAWGRRLMKVRLWKHHFISTDAELDVGVHSYMK